MRPHVPHVPERSAGTPGAPVTCSVPLPLKGSGRNAEHAPTRHAHASGGATGRNTSRGAPGRTESLPETGSATVSLEGGELVVRIRLDATPADELVAVAADPLAALGLELRAVQTLIADGKLRAVQIGRRRFTKLSYLLALVDELEAERPTSPHGQPADVLALAASKAARRASTRKRVADRNGGEGEAA